jgi:hypothetical protein
MAFCLTKDKAKEFLRKIKNRELDINKLADPLMSNNVRRKIFMDVLGLDEATAKEVNALFESKLLLKYQKTGIKNWIEKTAGLKSEVKRDLLTRVSRMEKALNLDYTDFIEPRLGAVTTPEQDKLIVDLAKEVESKKALVKDDSPIRSKERLDYGTALVNFQEYVRELKLQAEKKGIIDYLKRPQDILYGVGGATKSFLSTLDNSFFGRQGLKVLYTNPDIWAKNFAKSWADIGRELKGKDGMLPIKADIFSRPNAINNNYQRTGTDVGINSEEAYPSSLPEKIPLLGRIFKASQTAFNGAALRMRADLADKFIKQAEQQGIELTNKEQAQGIGNLVNSMTGRGSIGKAEAIAKEINALMFSIKFLKSNFDTLTIHLFDPKATAFTKKKAAINLLKIIGSLAAIESIAYAINPESIEFDPRSSDFGKIKVGKTRIDITGGLGSLAVLASRLVPTLHNGKLSFWQKSSTTGKWTDLAAGKYGQTTALDVIENFWEGKLAPMAGLLRDIWKGQNYDREKPQIVNSLKNLTTPISTQNFETFMKAGLPAEKILMFMILDGLGFGTTQYK